jgi:signal transduction histidine kinase
MPDQAGDQEAPKSLEQQLQEAQEANRALVRKNLQLVQFVNILATDLRSPLRHIMGFCRIVQHEYAPKLGPRGKSFLDNVVVSARRIRELVDDLVTITRVQHEEFQPKAVDLAEIFNDVTISLSVLIRETGARVSCGPLPKVKGSAPLLRILLKNLIDNALKYRHAQRRPEIRLEAERNPDGWQISVADNGIGIAPERFDAIFDAFQRSEDAHTAYVSSGLGLFVCKEIAERHHGRVWLQSILDKGSTFYFTISGRL